MVGGQFIGIELDEAVGKNSGTVKDKQYFVCPPMHGVLCRYIFIVEEILNNLTATYLCTLSREYDVDFVDNDDDDDDVPSMEDEVDLARAEKERQLGNELFGKKDWLGAIAK